MLFPKLFPNRDGSSSGASAKISPGSSWTPPTPINRRNDVRLTTISGGIMDGILQAEVGRDGKITKVMQFDLNSSHASGRSDTGDLGYGRV